MYGTCVNASNRFSFNVIGIEISIYILSRVLSFFDGSIIRL